ncbi:cyclin-dependent kinase 6-like isoform X2 [Syngnathoides biaculeatus]|uniref:cyclin-dependent kinase 6-like isoform X2 n=1 Tax=Syngnathoides biaculeatus TaxID=300417 RepID=UPI002ADE91D4|nr:cyclin-dependent kinase 6-like isoform X2 [Syngnathoides biaculeatus]
MDENYEVIFRTPEKMEVSASPLPYELLSLIRQGSFGKVFKAREIGGTGRLLAVKKFRNQLEPSSAGRGVPPFILREVALLGRMKFFDHPNIVKLLDVKATLEGNALDLTVILEYIDQDLSTYMSKAPPSGLSLDDIKGIMLQLMRGLDFMHANMVVRHEIKPENILISSSGLVKIVDFELARLYSAFPVVNICYRAPEVLLNTWYESAVDVWSAGCIFAELFLLKPLFRGTSEAQQLKLIFEFIGLPSEDEWPLTSCIAYSHSLGPRDPNPPVLDLLNPHAKDLLLECLTFAPGRRISPAGALAHPFFTQE